jgi:hypothetical protein
MGTSAECGRIVIRRSGDGGRTWIAPSFLTTGSNYLTHPDSPRHAFQYVDWQFDSEDLVVVSRTAFDDKDAATRPPTMRIS